ncbi:(Fe-S)-binding protein [Maledivibacter halophilus]|uniref:Fe-S oxidoreductase n=1 Tax=Maledivibacter halophilus TaxID=36842 RepID=A0A1T5KS06_9FIRM|nr:(Fe-S)-binding protein [Maledivibacter halophilus]SKC66305.1 Fe-S oxidoreductase [Maledivibacter halophilus]
MEEWLTNFYKTEKQKMIENCIECGLCVKHCSIVDKTDLRDLPPKKIQKDCLDFLKNGSKNDTVYTKAFSCVECYKCVEGICPQGLNPMVMNEIIRSEYIKNSDLEDQYSNPKDYNSIHKILSSIQVSKEDYTKITSSSEKKSSKYVFFPGCNVYFQPEKILNALDIIDTITKDYAFVPGLDYCCGNNELYFGKIEKGEKNINTLVDKLASYNPETVIFWCPTCQCRFDKTVPIIKDIPFKVVSFSQFVSEHMEKLPIKEMPNTKVTLHEPCKSAYTGLDLTGTRDILNNIPGIQLIEMPRHGRNTSCCGSWCTLHLKDSSNKVKEERLQEAANTNADLLIDVCHFCHEFFSLEEKNYNYSIINYANLLAEVVGIKREDKHKKYKHWKDLDMIMKDAQEFIQQSPYSEKEIIEILCKVYEISL